MYKDGNLRPLFRQNLRDGIHWQAIESPVTGSGVPDTNYCGGGVEGWIEFKKCESNKVRIDPFQVSWHEARIRHGGRTFLAVRKQEELHLYSGSSIRDVFIYGLKTKPLLHCFGGASRWDWPAVRNLLIK